MIDTQTISSNRDARVAARPRVQDVLQAVAEHYGISVDDLRSQRRSRRIAWPRQVACAVACEVTDKSLTQIGRAIGGRDHTTIIYARRKITRLRKENSRLDALVRVITGRFALPKQAGEG